MKDRIKQLMESMHMSQQAFSSFTGISAASLSSIFNERTKPTLATVDAIKKKIPTINLDWLMFGNGSMFIEPSAADDAAVSDGGGGAFQPSLHFDDTPAAPLGDAFGGRRVVGVQPTPNNSVRNDAKFIDKQSRQITEIRVFFDDQTWESFVPKK